MGQLFVELVKMVGPWLSKVLELIGWYLGALWEGFKDVVDNANTIIFVFTVAACAFLYADWKADKIADERVQAVHNYYAKKNKSPVRTVPNSTTCIFPSIFGNTLCN